MLNCDPIAVVETPSSEMVKYGKYAPAVGVLPILK